MSQLSRRTFLASTAGFLAGNACSTSVGGRATAASPRFERGRFVEDVKRALPGGQAAVAEVLARAVSQPGALIRELGAPQGRSVTLLHRDADLSSSVDQTSVSPFGDSLVMKQLGRASGTVS